MELIHQIKSIFCWQFWQHYNVMWLNLSPRRVQNPNFYSILVSGISLWLHLKCSPAIFVSHSLPLLLYEMTRWCLGLNPHPFNYKCSYITTLRREITLAAIFNILTRLWSVKTSLINPTDSTLVNFVSILIVHHCSNISRTPGRGALFDESSGVRAQKLFAC